MQQLFPSAVLVEPAGLEYFLASWNQAFLDFLETGKKWHMKIITLIYDPLTTTVM